MELITSPQLWSIDIERSSFAFVCNSLHHFFPLPIYFYVSLKSISLTKFLFNRICRIPLILLNRQRSWRISFTQRECGVYSVIYFFSSLFKNSLGFICTEEKKILSCCIILFPLLLLFFCLMAKQRTSLILKKIKIVLFMSE